MCTAPALFAGYARYTPLGHATDKRGSMLPLCRVLGHTRPGVMSGDGATLPAQSGSAGGVAVTATSELSVSVSPWVSRCTYNTSVGTALLERAVM